MPCSAGSYVLDSIDKVPRANISFTAPEDYNDKRWSLDDVPFDAVKQMINWAAPRDVDPTITPMLELVIDYRGELRSLAVVAEHGRVYVRVSFDDVTYAYDVVHTTPELPQREQVMKLLGLQSS